ncbi:glycosyltransferase family 2 protein [Haladaptatus sp. DFWS20]|uniref:glycosyltransferase family 2 protein n=1 Tax=Haladaptatus sp. DFWS20 TaxID=3403467 RepID=UPI003EBDB2FF
MSSPDVSIVTAAYNSADYIKQALESLRQQTIDDSRIEHLVVDDCSTDETAAIVESVETSYLRLIQKQENSGNGTIAWNHGIEHARGEYVVILDSDDEFFPSLVERSSDVLVQNDDVDFVYTDYYERFPDGTWEIVETDAAILNTVTVGVMHRTDHLRQFGLFDPEMIFAEYDLLLRYLDAGFDGQHIADPLFVYHRRRDSQTADSDRVDAGKEELRNKFGDDARIREYRV